MDNQCENKGIDVESKDVRAANRMVRAAELGKLGKISELVEAGVPLDAQGTSGRGALMQASYEGHTEIVDFLIEKGASLELVDEYGYTALMAAALSWRVACVARLLAAGAELEKLEYQGMTALALAIVGNETSERPDEDGEMCVRMLLAAGARMDAGGGAIEGLAKNYDRDTWIDMIRSERERREISQGVPSCAQSSSRSPLRV
jgi:hypothetical protein